MASARVTPLKSTTASWPVLLEGPNGRTARLSPGDAGVDPLPWQAERMADHPEQIRPARLADADGVWPLARDFATSFTPVRSAFDDTWTRLIGAPNTVLLVAETGGGDIVGYLLGNSHLTFLANGPVAWVEEVMVEQNSRGTGVGRRLMEHAEYWARTIGAGYLALASRRAGPFYAALDYKDSAVFFKKTLS